MGSKGWGQEVSGSRRSLEERIEAGERIICPRYLFIYLFLSGFNQCQFGLRYLLYWTPCLPGRSVIGPADTGPSPCADVGQQDFGWSVRPSATLKAQAGEGMGRPLGSLRDPKVIRRWLYPNWTENWCTRPPCCM